MNNGGRTARANNGFTHDVLGGSARQDSNLGMAESKSTWFALSINTRSEKSRRFDFNGHKTLADISECRDPCPRISVRGVPPSCHRVARQPAGAFWAWKMDVHNVQVAARASRCPLPARQLFQALSSELVHRVQHMANNSRRQPSPCSE